MRRKIIAGNWKMHMTTGEARGLVQGLRADLDGGPRAEAGGPEVVLCPPFTALQAVRDALDLGPQSEIRNWKSEIALGAQNCFWKEKGAYTGQTAPSMLADLGVTYVIVGHSETRGRFGVPEPDFDETILRYFGESDETVNRKARAALAAGLTPIICVGETIGERREGRTDDVVRTQVTAALSGVGDRVSGVGDSPRHPTPGTQFPVVFAYEPVWAIGTGEVCGPDEADRVCGLIRETVGGLFCSEAAETVRVQYGGSMKPDNAAELLSKPNIDGGLVGGASLKSADFAAIIRAA